MAKRQVIVIVGGLVAAVLIVALRPGEREPEYGGKTLSEWFYCIERPVEYTVEESRAAIRHMGTNALPWLIKWVAYERPAWRDKVLSAYDRLPSGIKSDSVEQWLLGQNQERKRDRALIVLCWLGADASPAALEMIRLVKESKSLAQQRRLLDDLGTMGAAARAAVPYLREIALDQKSKLRVDANLALQKIQPENMANIESGTIERIESGIFFTNWTLDPAAGFLGPGGLKDFFGTNAARGGSGK